MLCYCTIKNIDRFKEWLKEYGWADQYSFYGRAQDGGWYYNLWSDYFYHKQAIFKSNINNIFADTKCDDDNKTKTKEFFDFIAYINGIGQKLEVYYKDETASIIGYNKIRYVFPTEWLEFEELKDYSHLSGQELTLLGNPMGIENAIISSEGITKTSIQDKINNKNNQIGSLEEERKQIDNLEHEEMKDLKLQLEKIQQEIKQKQLELKEILAGKMEAFQAEKQRLEGQLFLLDTQIYGIRCYLGEVVNFHKLTEGKKAKAEEPVFIYQKIRYIDEELGKAALIYNIFPSQGEKRSFMELIKTRKEVRDLFLPDERCITLFEVSRTGTTSGVSDKIANVLVSYEKFHGSQLAILIRNGEETHIAWLDADKVQLKDENAFYSTSKKQTETEYVASEYKPSTKEEIASRYFLMSILQGVTDSGTIMDFPERINLLKPNPNYVIFSMAEGWLKDTRYGMFSTIMERVSSIPLKEGDMVLTATKITRDDRFESDHYGRSRRYEKYNNNRGIGERNRTSDAYIGRFQILPVNKVLMDIELHVECDCMKVVPKEKINDKNTMFYQRDYDIVKTEECLCTETTEFLFDFEDIDLYKDRGYLSGRPTENEWAKLAQRKLEGEYFYKDTSIFNGKVYEQKFQSLKHSGDNPVYEKRVKSVIKTEKHPNYFLSAKKEMSYNSDARANLKVEAEEVIPLTYLCPTWVRYAITTGNIGCWILAENAISYADALKYLGIILKHVDAVNKTNEELLKAAGLDSWMESNPEWDVVLTEWRIENKVRKMSEYQAKRFARHLEDITT